MRPVHHPVFQQFERTPHAVGETFTTNFVGALTRNEYEAELPSGPGGQPMSFTVSGRALATDADPTLPALLTEDYFEWVDLLESIDEAKDRFVMVELGAGYGRWLANAAAALRRHKTKAGLPAHFIGVEASPLRYCWLAQNFQDNRIDAAASRLVWGAVSEDEEPGFFSIYQSFWPGNQAHTYAVPFIKSDGSVFQRVDIKTDLDRHFPTIEYYVTPVAEGELYVRVRSFSLADLMGDHAIVDLVDMDIQGAELDVVRSNMAELNRKVRRVHIATHGEDIEQGIRAMLRAEGWENVWDLPYNKKHTTEYGEMFFCDGIQGWKNPAFRGR